MRAESHKSMETEFFYWLSDRDPKLLDEINAALKSVAPMFVQKKLLLASLFETEEKELISSALNKVDRTFSSKKIKRMAMTLLKTYGIFLDEQEKKAYVGASKKAAENVAQVGTKETSGIQSVPKSFLKSIRQYYPNGLRFDDTVLQLLEEYSGCEFNEKIRTELDGFMFKRRDGLCFLPDMIINAEHVSVLQRSIILEMLDKYGCIVVDVLYRNYITSGDSILLRDEEDFEDYLLFLMPDDIRITKKFNCKVVRKIGVAFNDAAQNAAQMVVKTIKENECITQEDILGTYPVFSETFLRKLMEKYTDEIVVTKINDCLCYQTIESLGIDSDFSLRLDAVLGEIERFSLMPSQDIIHALLSVKLGYNICEELGIPDDKTFRRIISMYYVGERQRTWKAKCFVEADIDYV